MECLTWVELANIHLAYSAVYFNGREALFLSQVFSEQCVSRLSYICIYLLWPMGNQFICSEQAQHRASTVSSYAIIWWECFAVFREQSLHKHPHIWCGSSCVECCMWAAAPSIPSVEGAGAGPQLLPLSTPICAPEYIEVVLMNDACITLKGIFNSHSGNVGAKQTFMPHLFTANHNTLRTMFRYASCTTFDRALLVTPMAYCTDLLGVCEGKAPRKCVVPAWWGCSSLCVSGPRTSHLHLQ